jgi:tetrahydromethanopterin S-methyltransferase subunit H
MILLEVTSLHITIAGVFMFLVAIAWLLAEFKGMKDEMRERLGINNETLKLRLQAYERLTLYAERAGLKNLVSRVSTSSFGESAAAMHNRMIEELKSEYEYNVSQQIYVSKEVWNAVTKLKDQNIYIINQIAGGLDNNSGSLDLSKRILEYTMTQNAELNTIVLDAIQFEAKKLLK